MERDCSTKSHYFVKYQELPTGGSFAVEQFNIDGSLFLAFANYNYYCGAKGCNTASFIYKLNDSTGKFALYQTIDTTGASDVKYVKIADQHYLGVAIGYGRLKRFNSSIFQWDGKQFVVFQNISTFGAIRLNFFKISPELFLVITSSGDNITKGLNSVTYKWKDNQFEHFQEIETNAARASTSFVINNETFLAFANPKSEPSPVYKWSNNSFVKVQTLPTSGATYVKSFDINGDIFLVFTMFSQKAFLSLTPSNSLIYKWDGKTFILFQTIPTYASASCHPFVMCGHTYLGFADLITSVVYLFSESNFVQYQQFPSASHIGGNYMTSFEHKRHIYLATSMNLVRPGDHNVNSTLYKWSKMD